MKIIYVILLSLIPTYIYGQGQQIRLMFVGDLMQHQAQIDAAYCDDGSYDYTHCFSLVREHISNADFAIGNFETTLGGKTYRGYPQFSAPDEYLYAIKNAGFDILATANNHSLDRRRHGLERTLTLIDSIGLLSVGTYRDSNDRTNRYPLIIEKNGLRIALLCATYGTNGIAPIPPNIVNNLNRKELAADIHTARTMNVDAIIAIVHWGDEYIQQPNDEQRALAHWLIDQGVDHIIGSHPHVVQPIELIPHTNYPTQHAVVYSLGNYISNMSIAHSTVGLAVELTIEKIGPTTRLRHLDYHLVWTERSALSRTANFRIIPEDTIPSDLTPYAKNHMLRAIATEKRLLNPTKQTSTSQE
ncbi:MAG: CapA family protein [Bacteroidaceae bacterium]|nr:CapA family protein [Bacteroidaceae bacterium]